MKIDEVKNDLVRVRTAINSLATVGNENAKLIVYAISKCDELIAAISKEAVQAEAGSVDCQAANRVRSADGVPTTALESTHV